MNSIEQQLKNFIFHYCPSDECGWWRIGSRDDPLETCPACGKQLKIEDDYQQLLNTYRCQRFHEQNEDPQCTK